MTHWKSFLRADPTAWLLKNDNPSVQYIALTEIQGQSDSSLEAQTVKTNIMRTGVVPKILAKQNQGGYWEKAEDFYIRSKYKGTVWQFIILAELMTDQNDKRIEETGEFILKWSQDRESGGFAYRGSKKNGGFHSQVIPCLTGNMTWSLIRLGYLDDPRVKNAIHWITTYQRFDDGSDKAPQGWPYEKFEQCWGKHTCTLGVVKGLKALSAIPLEKRTRDIEIFIQRASDFILKHHLYKRSRDLTRIAKPIWTKLGFPWMANTDALEMLLILTHLGYKDERMQEALDLVLSKQDGQGRWNLETTYNGRFQVNIERKGKPSKWVTLNALRVLKGFYG
jgi:hypothetical protein